MTPQRETKRLQRTLRSIPEDAITPTLDAFESAGQGLWCLIGGDLCFVHAHSDVETTIDDDLVVAQIERWVSAHAERIHPTHKAAMDYVRSQLQTRSNGTANEEH